MRILILLTSLGIGGAEKQALRVAEGMAARGHQVEVLVLLAAQPNQWSTALRTTHLNLRKSPLSVIRGLLRARKIVVEFRPHIAHSHTFPANLFARLLKLLGVNFKLISTIHNLYEGGGLRMLAYRLTDSLSAQSTAVSHAAARRFICLKAVPAEKMMVITNGMDTDEFSRRIQRAEAARQKGGEFTWLAAGRITAAKDYPNLLRAFALLRDEEPATRLLIAGEGTAIQQSALLALARELGLTNSIDWLGMRRDLQQLMEAADGFVLSSAWEGMPLVIGEAMAMELPVVATDVGGVRELTGECARLVPPQAPAKLARELLAVQRMTEEERRTLGRLARARMVDHFNIAHKPEEWAALYGKSLIERRRSLLRAPLFTAAALRILFLFIALTRTGISIITGGDTFSYLLPGLSLLHADRFFNPGGPELDRTPGYPLFLALASAPGFLIAVFLQMAISIASIWLAARIARRIFASHPRKTQIGALAAWLLAFDPLSIAYSIKLYPESIFVFLLLLALSRFLNFLDSKNHAALAQSAIALAATAYFKPITYYLPLFLFALLMVLFRKIPRHRWQSPLLFLLLTAALLAPWQLRNWRLACFSGFSTVQQRNLYFFQAAGVVAETGRRPFSEIQQSFGYGDNAAYWAAHPEQIHWSQSALAAYQGRAALCILRAHPFTTAWLQLKGGAIVALTPGAADFFALLGTPPLDAPARFTTVNALAAATQFARLNPAHFLLMLIFSAYLLGLYGVSLLALIKMHFARSAKLTLMLVAVYFLFLSGGAQAVARYRLPLMPILCLLAAGGAALPRLNWFSRGQDDSNITTS